MSLASLGMKSTATAGADFQQQTIDSIAKLSAINPEAGTLLANAYANKTGAGAGNLFGSLFSGIATAVGAPVKLLVEGFSRWGSAITEPFRNEAPEEADNFAVDFWQGLTGQEHTTWSRNLASYGMEEENNPMRAVLGLTMDIALDPLTYLTGPGALMAKGTKALAAKEITEAGVKGLLTKEAGEQAGKSLASRLGFNTVEELAEISREKLISRGVSEDFADVLAGGAAKGGIHTLNERVGRAYQLLSEEAGNEVARRVAQRGGLANATSDWLDPLGRMWKSDELYSFVQDAARLKPDQAVDFARNVLGKQGDDVALMASAQEIPRQAAGALGQGYRMRFGVPFGQTLYKLSNGAVHPFWAYRWQSGMLPGTHRLSQRWRNFARGTMYIDKLDNAVLRDTVEGLGEKGFTQADHAFALEHGVQKLGHEMARRGAAPRYHEVFGNGVYERVLGISAKVGGMTEAVTPFAKAMRVHGFAGALAHEHIKKAHAERLHIRSGLTKKSKVWGKSIHRMEKELGGEIPAEVLGAARKFLFEYDDDALELVPNREVQETLIEMREAFGTYWDEVIQKGGDVASRTEIIAYNHRVDTLAALKGKIDELLQSEVGALEDVVKAGESHMAKGVEYLGMGKKQISTELKRLKGRFEQIHKQVEGDQVGGLEAAVARRTKPIEDLSDVELKQEYDALLNEGAGMQSDIGVLGGSWDDVPVKMQEKVMRFRAIRDRIEERMAELEYPSATHPDAAPHEIFWDVNEFSPKAEVNKLKIDDAELQDLTSKIALLESLEKRLPDDTSFAIPGLDPKQSDELIKYVDIIDDYEALTKKAPDERAAGYGHADALTKEPKKVSGFEANLYRTYQMAREKVTELMKLRGHSGGSLAVTNAQGLVKSMRASMLDESGAAALFGKIADAKAAIGKAGDKVTDIQDELDKMVKQMEDLANGHMSAEEFDRLREAHVGPRAMEKANAKVMFARRLATGERRKAIEALAATHPGKDKYAFAKTKLAKLEREMANMTDQEAALRIQTEIPALAGTAEELLFENNPMFLYRQYMEELVDAAYDAALARGAKSMIQAYGGLDNSIGWKPLGDATPETVQDSIRQAQQEIETGVQSTRALVEAFHARIADAMPKNPRAMSEDVQVAMEIMAKQMNRVRAQVHGVAAKPTRAMLNMSDVTRQGDLKAAYNMTLGEFMEARPTIKGLHYHGGDEIGGEAVDINRGRPYTFKAFYVTDAYDKAAEYASGSLGTGFRSGRKGGVVNYVKLTEDLRLLNMSDEVNTEVWDDVLRRILPNPEDLVDRTKLMSQIRKAPDNNFAMTLIGQHLKKATKGRADGLDDPRIMHILGEEVKRGGKVDAIVQTERVPGTEETYEALGILNPKKAKVLTPTEVHRKQIEEAIDEGRRVPEHVLKDHPGLLEYAQKHGQVGGKDLTGWAPVHVPSLEGWYMPVYIAQEFNHAWNKAPVKRGPVREAYVKYLQGPWKKWATLYWPGFHARNNYGAWFNNWLGGVSVEHYYVALKLFKAHKDDTFAQTKLPKWMRMGVDGGEKKLETWGDLAKLTEMEGITGYNSLQIIDLYKAGQSMDSLIKPDRPLLTKLGTDKANVGNFVEGWENFGSQAALWSENLHRWAAYVKGLSDTGGDTAGARAFTMVRHGDYDELTDLEYSIKDIMPFYKWIRTNVPFQLRQLAEAPGRSMATIKTANSLASEEDKAQFLPDYMRDKFILPTGGKLGAGASFMAFDLPLYDAMTGAGEYATSVLPFIKEAFEVGVVRKDLFTGAPLEGTRVKRLHGALTAGPLGFVAESTGLAKRGADGELYVTDRQEKLLSVFPIYTKARHFISENPNRKPERLKYFASMVTGTALDEITEEDLTAKEAAFFFDQVQPMLELHRNLGFELPSKDDLVAIP